MSGHWPHLGVAGAVECPEHPGPAWPVDLLGRERLTRCTGCGELTALAAAAAPFETPDAYVYAAGRWWRVLPEHPRQRRTA